MDARGSRRRDAASQCEGAAPPHIPLSRRVSSFSPPGEGAPKGRMRVARAEIRIETWPTPGIATLIRRLRRHLLPQGEGRRALPFRGTILPGVGDTSPPHSPTPRSSPLPQSRCFHPPPALSPRALLPPGEGAPKGRMRVARPEIRIDVWPTPGIATLIRRLRRHLLPQGEGRRALPFRGTILPGVGDTSPPHSPLPAPRPSRNLGAFIPLPPSLRAPFSPREKVPRRGG